MNYIRIRLCYCLQTVIPSSSPEYAKPRAELKFEIQMCSRIKALKTAINTAYRAGITEYPQARLDESRRQPSDDIGRYRGQEEIPFFNLNVREAEFVVSRQPR